MKIISYLLIIVLLGLIAPSISQDNESVSDTDKPNVQQPTPEQLYEMSKNVYYSCIIVTRHYLNSGEGVVDQLKEIAGAYSDIPNSKQKQDEELNVWKRVYLDAVHHCVSSQTHEGAMKVFEMLQSGQFDPLPFFPIVNTFQFETYKNKKANLSFSQQEEMVWEMMQDFEDKIRQNQRNNQIDEDEFDPRNPRGDYQDYEPKIFGVSLKQDSKIVQVGLILFVFTVFGLAIIYGLRTVTKDDSPKKKQKKKKVQ